MASTSRLSHRIELLLNENHFRQAFAASRGALAAVVVVPLALVASAAVVQVHAATPQQDQAQSQGQQMTVTVQSDNTQTPPPQTPGDAAPPPPPPGDGPDHNHPPMPPAGPDGTHGPDRPMQMRVFVDRHQGPEGPEAPGAPEPPEGPGHPESFTVSIQPPPVPGRAPHAFTLFMSPQFGSGPHGEHWALIGDQTPDHTPGFTANEIAKARKLAHGHFLIYRKDGKTYVIDDPATIAQLEASHKSAEELQKQMEELGRQQDAEARKLGEQMRQLKIDLNVKLPDLSKEMAGLNAAMTTLKSRQGTTISQQELGELERRLGDLEQRLAEAQRPQIAELHEQMRGPEWQKFDEQMRAMGEKLGQSYRENDEKIRSTIDESEKAGKARPVE